jgi:hypothetical protein
MQVRVLAALHEKAPQMRGFPSQLRRASDALARLVLRVFELLLALADLLLGLAFLLAELVVCELAFGLLEPSLHLVAHAFHADPFRLG